MPKCNRNLNQYVKKNQVNRFIKLLCLKWTSWLSGNDYAVATLSKLYLSNQESSHTKLEKSIGQGEGGIWHIYVNLDY